MTDKQQDELRAIVSSFFTYKDMRQSLENAIDCIKDSFDGKERDELVAWYEEDLKNVEEALNNIAIMSIRYEVSSLDLSRIRGLKEMTEYADIRNAAIYPSSGFYQYRKRGYTDIRPIGDKEISQYRRSGVIVVKNPTSPPAVVSISEADIQKGSPKKGDYIARNPKDFTDQWLIEEDYFKENYEKVPNAPGNPFINSPLDTFYGPAPRKRSWEKGSD